MSSKRNMGHLLYIVDYDKQIFNIIGPLKDDTLWNKKVIEAQKAGRDVRCFSGPDNEDREYGAREYSKQMGFTFTEESVL